MPTGVLQFAPEREVLFGRSGEKRGSSIDMKPDHATHRHGSMRPLFVASIVVGVRDDAPEAGELGDVA